MQLSDRIGRRMKLHDLHVLMAVVQAKTRRPGFSILPSRPFPNRSRNWSEPWACVCSTVTPKVWSRLPTVATVGAGIGGRNLWNVGAVPIGFTQL
jgi:hypothetical protein